MERRKSNKNLKRFAVSFLTLVLVLTASLMPIGGVSAQAVAYAETIAQVTLKVVEEDQLNDRIVLAATLDQNVDTGISYVGFDVNYPQEYFQLVKVEDKKLMGADDKSTSFGSQSTAECPYKINFGSMDESTEGIYNGTGDIAYFTFGVKEGVKSLPADTYKFILENIEVGTVYGDKSPEYPQVNKSSECTYTSIKSNVSTEESENGTVKITTPTGTETSEIPVVKTETIKKAIENAEASEIDSITLDLSSESASAETNAEASIALSKTGAAAIAKDSKSLEIKTDAGNLKFNQAATESIGKQDGGEKLVIEVNKENADITVDEATQKAVQFDVTAKLVDLADPNKTKNITSFDGGEVEVTLDLPKELQEKELKCWYYTDRNYVEVDRVSTGDDTKFVFLTNHFSPYMVATQEAWDAFNGGTRTPGVTVSGTVTSRNSVNDTVVYLYPATAEITAIKNDIKSESPSLGQKITLDENIVEKTLDAKRFDQKYSITGITEGEYVIAVYKPKHALYITNKLDIDTDMVQNIELYLLGDVNKDGNVNAIDNTLFARYLAKWPGYTNLSVDISTLDIDGNGKVNAVDKTLLSRYLAKWPDSDQYFR